MEGGDNQAISNSGVVEILSYLYQEMKARDWTDKWIDRRLTQLMKIVSMVTEGLEIDLFRERSSN